MSFVYILRSLKDAKLYVGTTDNIDQRLTKHNKGQVKSTKNRTPFTAVFSKEFPTLREARKYEGMLKYTPGGGKLKKSLASGAGGSSNGRTAAFGAVNDGSIPSPPAPDSRNKSFVMAPRSLGRPGSRPKA